MNDVEIERWIASQRKGEARSSEMTGENGQYMREILTYRTHHLKVSPTYFHDLWNGNKTFEVRRNDRAFQKGDLVVLQEYDESKTRSADKYRYTGRKIKAIIGFVLTEYQQEGYVTFSLIDMSNQPQEELGMKN
jgi:hypothetical protein